MTTATQTHVDGMWPHQQDAVEAVSRSIGEAGRALVVMACGTGKTRVGDHWPYDGPHSPERLASALDTVSGDLSFGCSSRLDSSSVAEPPQEDR